MKTSQSKFAEMLGISRQRVGQYVATGLITLDKNGKIDPDLAQRQLMENLDYGRREDWESSLKSDEGGGSGPSGRMKSSKPKTKPVQEYIVKKQFIEKIGREEFLIPVGTLMRVYSDKGRVEIAFFPKRKEG